MRASRSVVAQGSEVGPEHRLAWDAELLGDGGSGDHVVARDHADPDAGLLARRGRPPRTPRGEDRPWRRCDAISQLGDVAEQVTLGVEGRRVEVADGRGHHPLPLALHAGITASSRPLLQALVPRHAAAPGRRSRGPLHHRRRRALDEAADHVVAGGVGRRVERRHQLVGGVERQRGQPRQRLPGWLSMSSPALCARTSSAPSVGSPTTLPSTSLASLAMMYGMTASSGAASLPAAWWTLPSSS